MTFVPQDWSNCFLCDGTSWCGRRGGARARLLWEGDHLGPSPSSVGEGDHPSSTEEREFESSESGGEESHPRFWQGNLFQSDLLLNSWESPKMYPRKLYSGPTIQSRSAARRAAEDLVISKEIWDYFSISSGYDSIQMDKVKEYNHQVPRHSNNRSANVSLCPCLSCSHSHLQW